MGCGRRSSPGSWGCSASAASLLALGRGPAALGLLQRKWGGRRERSLPPGALPKAGPLARVWRLALGLQGDLAQVPLHYLMSGTVLVQGLQISLRRLLETPPCTAFCIRAAPQESGGLGTHSGATSAQERLHGAGRDQYGKTTGRTAVGQLTARGRGKHYTRGHHPTQQTRGSWSEDQEHLKHTFSTSQASASLRNKTQLLPQEEAPNLVTAGRVTEEANLEKPTCRFLSSESSPKSSSCCSEHTPALTALSRQGTRR